MRIAVVFNLSSEGVINVFGRQNKERYRQDEMDAVVAALRSRKHTVETFEGDKSLIANLEAFMPQTLKGETPGLVFNLAYGIQGESRYTHIPSLLEMVGIPYVGSGPLAHSVALDKAMTKMVLCQAGVPTPAFQVITDPTQELDRSLRFPLIVKPKDEAVSFGIRVVHDEDGLKEAVEHNLEEFRQPMLVEEFLDGREVNIGLLGNGTGDGLESLPLVEIDFGDATERIQTYNTKKGLTFEHVCPAQLPEELADEIRALSRRAFNVVGCKDCARVDLRLDKDDRPHILEINSMPAIHRNGSFAIAARHVGYDYDAMINRMVEVASLRYFGEAPTTSRKARRAGSGEEAAQARVADFLRSASDKMEVRLADLVEHKSFARNKGITDKLGLTMQRAFEQLGFSCSLSPQTEIGDIRLFQNDSTSRHADILLVCHTDLVTRSEDRHRRFRKEGSRLYGSGIAESKSGLVVIEYALRALRHIRLLPNLRVKILLTSDASLGNKYSEPTIQQQSALCKRVLCFKPGGAKGEVVTRRNGMGYFNTVVEGDGIHMTGDNIAVGVNSIDELAHKIRAWNRLSRPADGIYVYVNSLKARDRSSDLPDHAHASIFLSFPRQEDGEHLVREIKKIAKKSFVEGSRCALTTDIMRTPFSETEQVKGLWAELVRVSDTIGRPLGAISRCNSSELNVVPIGVPALDGLGPAGYDTRTSNEHIEARTLVERAVLLSLYMRSLAINNKNDV
jgi:D-alanine-D-alanine ligase